MRSGPRQQGGCRKSRHQPAAAFLLRIETLRDSSNIAHPQGTGRVYGPLHVMLHRRVRHVHSLPAAAATAAAATTRAAAGFEASCTLPCAVIPAPAPFISLFTLNDVAVGVQLYRRARVRREQHAFGACATPTVSRTVPRPLAPVVPIFISVRAEKLDSRRSSSVQFVRMQL